MEFISAANDGMGKENKVQSTKTRTLCNWHERFTPSPAKREREGVRAQRSLATLTFILSLRRRARKKCRPALRADTIACFGSTGMSCPINSPADPRSAAELDSCNRRETKYRFSCRR